MGLKNVIVLSDDDVDENFACFLDDCGIQLICIGNSGMLLQPITEETVIQALRILVNKSNYPILITCKTGKTLTGAVIACLRKLQRWSFISIFDEYRRIAGHSGSKLQQQHEQFIEQFDTDLVTCTESAPSFLIFESQKDQF